MAKATKTTKKSTIKMRKSNPKTKPNDKSNILKSGAPEKANNNHSTTTASNFTMNEIRMIRKALKVKFKQAYDKQIRKASRSLNKLKKTNASHEEIQIAEKILQEANDDLEEALQWMHPIDTIEKLNQILTFQIENQVDIDIIEATKNYILDAEESKDLIEKGKKEAWFFRIVEVNHSQSNDSENTCNAH